MNNDKNNITNINEYRENIMPDASAYNINNYPSYNMPSGMVNDGANMGFDTNNNVEEFVSEEFVNAYLNATNQNTPDLWSRIESGFEEEARDIIVNQKVKSARTKKVVGFVAAVALITIIAVPVMKMGMSGTKNEECTMMTESTTTAQQEVYYDEAADSVEMEAPEDSAMVEDATEAAPEVGIQNTVTSDASSTNNETATQLKDIEGVQTDDRQIVVEGEFLFDGDSNEVSFKIKAISDNQYNEFVIDIGDKITISNSMFVLTMDVMLVEGKITLDSVEIDEVGNITGRIIDLENQGISIEKDYIDK